MCSKVAKLCSLCGINVSEKTVFTHYEFSQSHPKTSSYGKIDFTYLPYRPNLQKERIGDYLRNKIQWYQIQQEALKSKKNFAEFMADYYPPTVTSTLASYSKADLYQFFCSKFVNLLSNLLAKKRRIFQNVRK